MNLQFKNIEFNDMMYNPSKITSGKSVFDVYKELNKYPEFKMSHGEGLDNELVMLYIFCMYDKETPYKRKYPDVIKRKLIIAKEVGFPKEENGEFTSVVEDMLKGLNKVIQRKIVAFVRMHRDYQYTYHVGIDNSYYNLMEHVMNGDSKKIPLLKEIKKELEESLHELLNGDNNRYSKEEVLKYIDDERLLLRPEDVALKMKKNEQPVTVEKIRK